MKQDTINTSLETIYDDEMVAMKNQHQELGTPKPISPTTEGKAAGTSLMTPATMASTECNSSYLYPSFPNSPASHLSIHSCGGHSTGFWMPHAMHSPSRPRLDPRYSARLPPPLMTPQTTGTPNPNGPSFFVDSSATTNTTMDADTSASDLMPPPAVRRCEGILSTTATISALTSLTATTTTTTTDCNNNNNLQSQFFRPTPIITPTSNAAAEMENDSLFDDCELDGRCWTPRRPSPKRTRSEHLYSSTSPYSHQECKSGDRFIPNRSTSSSSKHYSNLNLWEGIAERSSAARASRNANQYYNSFQNSNYGGDMDISEHSHRSANNNGNNNSSNTNTSDSSGGAASSATTSNGDASSGAQGASHPASANTFSASAQQNLHNALLRSELLGENDDSAAARTGLLLSQTTTSSLSNNHFRFSSPRQVLRENVFDPASVVNAFSLAPVNTASERLIATPNKQKRRISKVPFKVLDAPALQDDFYLNLVDWSSHNVLAVGLGSCVYLWSACTSKVTKLCDLTASNDSVTAVSWAQRGTHLSVGTDKGDVQLWDTIKCKKVRSMSGHSARVGTLAWTGPILASGSRDRLIYLRDVRVQAAYTDKLAHHRQEVCGLKWSFEEPAFLASGGNDNNLHVIDSRNPADPLHKFTEHTAAVKAIAWSPHQHGLLASGGGTADRCIRFWNTLSGSSLNKIDTGSQVCNLSWSKNCNEIVSTHGYSLNQIVVWRYPSMSKVATLTGHTFRVLYLAMSPDGSTVVTGAGDETLRFWQIFPGPRSDGKDRAGGLLFPNTTGSVIR